MGALGHQLLGDGEAVPRAFETPEAGAPLLHPLTTELHVHAPDPQALPSKADGPCKKSAEQKRQLAAERYPPTGGIASFVWT